MASSTALAAPVPIPAARDVLRLLKPVTWFPPMWAFLCGVVSSGVPLGARLSFLIAGMLLHHAIKSHFIDIRILKRGESNGNA